MESKAEKSTSRARPGAVNPLKKPRSKRTDYGDNYVAFVDILGFKELVSTADKSESLREGIVEALKRVRQLPKSISPTPLRSQNFSDSLILSTDRTPEGLWRLLLALDDLSINLLNLGILSRGAVVMGAIYQDDNIVFGVGVNEAYRLESVVAKYPRVILSKQALADATRYAKLGGLWQAYRATRLLRDFDGVTFINYLNDLAAANRHPRPNVNESNDAWGNAGRKIQGILQAKIDETVDAPDVYDKVRWLGAYWNEIVAGNAIDPDKAAFDRIRLAGEEPRFPALPFRSNI